MQAKIVLHGKNLEEILSGLNRNFRHVDVKVKNECAECIFEECEESRNALNKTVREYVVNVLEPIKIRGIINRGYSFFNTEERKKLTMAVQSAIEGPEDIHDQLFVMRRNRIIESVSDRYFRENVRLNLEGFLNFRLKIYNEELEEVVEYNAEAFMLQKEYEEFVELLKTYVSVQPHSLKKLDVVITENRQYIFFDSSGRNITAKLERETEREFGRENRGDDLLINVLITKNPGLIVVHNRRFMRKEVADTLKAVFGERYVVCAGCEMCRVTADIRRKHH